MGADSDPVTLSMLSPESSKVIHSVVPEGELQAPFEVVFQRILMDAVTSDSAMPYRMLELWTERRLYVIDSTFTCVEVIDRKSRQTDIKHPFLNGRLLGGQRREGSSVHQIKPFPIVGTSAVFEKSPGPGQPKLTQVTSKVERVALHIRVATVRASEPSISLDQSGASIRVPKP